MLYSSTPAPKISRFVGRVICTVRQKRGISQFELAILTGLKQPNISRIESGQCTPRFATLERIAEALQVSILELLDENRLREMEKAWGDQSANAGKKGILFNGTLAKVPFFDESALGPTKAAAEPSSTASNSPSHSPRLALQLPAIPGHAFAVQLWDHSMEAPQGAPYSFKCDEILVFGNRPKVSDGDFAFVLLENRKVFRKVYFPKRQRKITLVPLNESYPEETHPISSVKNTWRLVRRIESF